MPERLPVPLRKRYNVEPTLPMPTTLDRPPPPRRTPAPVVVDMEYRVPETVGGKETGSGGGQVHGTGERTIANPRHAGWVAVGEVHSVQTTSLYV